MIQAVIIFERSPRPNNNTIKGTRAILGKELNATINGSKIFASTYDLPKIRPTKTPEDTPTRKPQNVL